MACLSIKEHWNHYTETNTKFYLKNFAKQIHLNFNFTTFQCRPVQTQHMDTAFSPCSQPAGPAIPSSPFALFHSSSGHTNLQFIQVWSCLYKSSYFSKSKPAYILITVYIKKLKFIDRVMISYGYNFILKKI